MALQNLPFLQSLPTVTAQTTDEYSSNFTATITLDKGRADGVDVGYPVVGSGGLVGQVIQSFHHTCVVQLITDGQSKVGVTFGAPAHRHCGRAGSRQRPDAGPGAAAHPADTRASSSPPAVCRRRHSRRASRSATVESFHTAAGASQESVTVDAAADLSQLAYVDVVQWEPPT